MVTESDGEASSGSGVGPGVRGGKRRRVAVESDGEEEEGRSGRTEIGWMPPPSTRAVCERIHARARQRFAALQLMTGSAYDDALLQHRAAQRREAQLLAQYDPDGIVGS